MRILVVEDNPEMRSYLKMTLERESYVVDCADNGEKGSYMARTNEYDLVLLDNVLPQKMGLEVCKDIRKSEKNTPIMLLSVRSEIEEKTLHLDSGADDYLTKPYSHQELVSRIKALTRRQGVVNSAIFTIGDLTLNSLSHEVFKGKKEIYLTRKEFALLELLLRNKGKIVSRGTILEHVWEIDSDPHSKTVETHILNLRKKIGSKKRQIIFNVPGRGYKIHA